MTWFEENLVLFCRVELSIFLVNWAPFLFSFTAVLSWVYRTVLLWFCFLMFEGCWLRVSCILMKKVIIGLIKDWTFEVFWWFFFPVSIIKSEISELISNAEKILAQNFVGSSCCMVIRILKISFCLKLNCVFWRKRRDTWRQKFLKAYNCRQG